MTNKILKMTKECKDSLNNTYGFKEVPDLFFVNKRTNEIFYCIDTLTTFHTTLKENGKWYLSFTSNLFSDNLFNFLKDSKQKFDIYVRSFKRKREDSKDYDFCLKFNSTSVFSISFYSAADGDPCNFPITFICNSMNVVNSNECPKIELNNDGEKIICCNNLNS